MLTTPFFALLLVKDDGVVVIPTVHRGKTRLSLLMEQSSKGDTAVFNSYIVSTDVEAALEHLSRTSHVSMH